MGGRGSGGHNRKPAELHLLTGTYRRDRHGPAGRLQPVGQEEVPQEPPEWVGEYGKQFWRQYAPICLQMGTLDALSLTLFEALCGLWHQFMAMEEQIQREGLVRPGPRGPRAHPLLSARNRTLQQVLRLMDDFGLSPLGRQRLGISWPPEDDADPFSRFLEEARKGRGERP